MRNRRLIGSGLWLFMALLMGQTGCMLVAIDSTTITEVVDAASVAIPTSKPTVPVEAISKVPTRPSTAFPAITKTPQSIHGEVLIPVAPDNTAEPAVTIPPTDTVLSTPIAEPTATLTMPSASSEYHPYVTQIGESAGGRPIYSHSYGSGPVDIILVGGMHGGYEWNTVLLAQEFLTYFQENVEMIPSTVRLHIVPNANPDGLAAVVGGEFVFQSTDVISNTVPGRFNGSGVDLNRNWDCRWIESAQWAGRNVSGGSYPFSEPETRSLSEFFLRTDPALVVLWHSAADGIYASGCPDTDPSSYSLAQIYGAAAGYPVYPSFDYYEVTGDAGDWLVTQGIPAITVELATHEETDWEQNLAGVRAILAHYAGGDNRPSRE